MLQEGTRRALVAIGMGIIVGSAASTAWCPRLEAEELKVGYVNIGKVFDGYGRTKVSDAALEKKGKEK